MLFEERLRQPGKRPRHMPFSQPDARLKKHIFRNTYTIINQSVIDSPLGDSPQHAAQPSPQPTSTCYVCLITHLYELLIELGQWLGAAVE